MSERSTVGPQLQVGDIAPNITLTKTTGECITLAELLRQGRVLLVFLRHFG
ncbi:MAG: hypothetical protein ACFLMY_03590 [Candidatus Brachytrichaceae bacterium NZ_4S206]|jgi:peroxiredoxin